MRPTNCRPTFEPPERRAHRMSIAGLEGVLGQSAYAGVPNAGTYAAPSVITSDPSPAATDAFTGTGKTFGLGVGRLSLTMLAVIIIGLGAFAYWTHPISA